VPKAKSPTLIAALQAAQTLAAARIGEIIADGGRIDVIP
jgi:hypothetical protein